ncbi:MAG: hypothetical protein V4484_06200 [Pseudomonadota bacterium]
MSAAYQHLALSQVKPGMILSDEVLDQQGQILLPKGAVLSARTIALLPSHGIDSLAVLAPGGMPDAPAVAADSGAVARRLARLFRKLDPADDEFTANGQLRHCITTFRLEPEAAP